MKKSYFMHSLNSFIFLSMNTLVLAFFIFLCNFVLTSFAKSEIIFIQKISDFINVINVFLLIVEMLTITVIVLIISIEVVNRFRKDKIMNYFKSFYSTMLLRHFLTQRTEKVKPIEGQNITTYNLINKTFNRAVRKCVVDIHQDNICVIIKIPSRQQAQKLLKEMEQQIKEEIESRNPDYYFSTFIRVKNTLWLEGKRK